MNKLGKMLIVRMSGVLKNWIKNNQTLKHGDNPFIRDSAGKTSNTIQSIFQNGLMIITADPNSLHGKHLIVYSYQCNKLINVTRTLLSFSPNLEGPKFQNKMATVGYKLV